MGHSNPLLLSFPQRLALGHGILIMGKCLPPISAWTSYLTGPLRLVHAFGLSAPSVLVQGYIMASAGTASVGGSATSEAASSSTTSSTAEDVERSLKIHVISSALSLFNICWGKMSSQCFLIWLNCFLEQSSLIMAQPVTKN